MEGVGENRGEKDDEEFLPFQNRRAMRCQSAKPANPVSEKWSTVEVSRRIQALRPDSEKKKTERFS